MYIYIYIIIYILIKEAIAFFAFFCFFILCKKLIYNDLYCICLKWYYKNKFSEASRLHTGNFFLFKVKKLSEGVKPHGHFLSWTKKKLSEGASRKDSFSL